MRKPLCLPVGFVLIFFVSVLASYAQPIQEIWFPFQHKYKNGYDQVLLVRNVDVNKYLPVRSGTWLRIRTSNGNSFSGKVQRIFADSVFLADTIILAGKIDSIFISKAIYYSISDTGYSRLVYASDSSQWQMVIPPDYIYSMSGGWVRYKGYLEKKVRNGVVHQIDPLFYGNFIKFNCSKLFRLEIAFSYERKIARKTSWETEFGVFIPSDIQILHSYSMSYLLYHGFSVTTNPKIFFINPRIYLGPVFMYRYLWGTGIRTEWPGKDGHGKLQDQYRNDFGLSARIGGMFCSNFFVIDLYLGAGIKVIQLHQLVYGSYLYNDSSTMYWYNPDHSPNVDDQLILEPVINIGFKIGFAFR